MNTLIKGLKEIVSLYDYCENNGLLCPDDTMSINKEDIDPEFEQEIDKSRLNDIFVELLLCKLSYQVKAFNNVAWIPELNEAYIELGHYETIHVSFELDDRLCFGTHDTIHILYCVTPGKSKKHNQKLIDQITKFVETKPNISITTAGYKIKTERDSSLWSADPSEESDFVKIVHKMSEIAKAFESQE